MTRGLVSRKVVVCTMWAPTMATVAIFGAVGLMIQLDAIDRQHNGPVAVSNAEVRFGFGVFTSMLLCLV